MLPSLPPTIAVAIDRCVRPTLVFDHARLERNVRAAGDAARAAGITMLFASKSFAHPAMRALAATWLDGFDAASAAEVGELEDVRDRVLSVADPSGRAGGSAEVSRWRGRLIVSCETPEQIRAAPAPAAIAIRVSASVTATDPAIGAVLDGTGHRRSRLGLDVDRDRRRAAYRDLVDAARGRPVGLHLHHGPVTATSAARFVTSARALLATAADAGHEPAFLNLGGAWHGLADLGQAFTELRAAVPRGVELIVEPGRALVDGAGFACGHVVAARALDDRRLRVVDLSRICHLRWSPVELALGAPRPGEGQLTLVVGPTCFEDDVLGEWTTAPDDLEPGARVVLRHVSGYAVAWNTGFGGVAPAEVVIA